MSVKNISSAILGVGVDDTTIDLFESQYPVPTGVSYNSYVIRDEKIAILDTVDDRATDEWMANVTEALAGEKPAYLVVHHMEPDHSANMARLAALYPEMQVVGNAKTFQYMEQFFGAEAIAKERRVVVKDGESLSLGAHTLTFVFAPMVHWPEAMVTFDTTNGALFSADAFGSFIALDGKLFADEVNFDRDWIDEARRYLTNIVGKYGPHIQLLLGKAAGILDQIKFICPLHGPVWRKDLGYFIDKYDKWSRYEPEEKGVMIAYASMYGNTEAAAQALAARLCEKGITNVSVYDVSNTHVSYLISEAFKYSHIVLASVTYNLGIYPVMKSFLEDMKALNLQNRTFALIENGSWACKSGDLMQKFIDEEMKNMTVLNERLSMASSLSDDKAVELDALADALVDSIQA